MSGMFWICGGPGDHVVLVDPSQLNAGDVLIAVCRTAVSYRTGHLGLRCLACSAVADGIPEPTNGRPWPSTAVTITFQGAECPGMVQAYDWWLGSYTFPVQVGYRGVAHATSCLPRDIQVRKQPRQPTRPRAEPIAQAELDLAGRAA